RGNKIKEINASNDQLLWSYDYFGRIQSHTDMSSGAYTYSYDKAGHLIQQSLTRSVVIFGFPFPLVLFSGTTTYEYYENGLVKRISDGGVGGETYMEYDAAGNRTRERHTKNGRIYRDERSSYDELERLKTVKDDRIQLL